MRKEHDKPGSFRTGGLVATRRQGDQLIMEFPANGASGSIGAFLFAALFAGFGLLGIIQTLGAALILLTRPGNPTPPHSIGEALKTLLGCGVFFAIGVGLALLVLDGARRRTTITLDKEKLLILYVGIFGERRYEWPLDEVAEVFTAPCGGPKGKINRKLQVQTFDGRARGFLRGREHTEVEHAARTLRSALGMDAIPL